MNNSNSKQPNKFTRFLRNNAALLLLIFCVLAITAVVLAVTLTRNNNNVVPDDPVSGNPDDNKPSDVTPGDDQPTTPSKQKIDVYFKSPLEYTKVGLEYTYGPDHLFVWKQTLNEWSAHKAVDLHAEEGAEVTAMYDGTVIKADSTFGNGYYVTIDHGDGVIATYASLKDLEVKAGDNVKQGDVLGYISTTAECEYKEGPHLHLEVTLNGEATDPMPYVNGEVYRTIEVETKA